ncbi:MAG: hypothetical protein ABSF67_17725 [Roseiarcus sp.]
MRAPLDLPTLPTGALDVSAVVRTIVYLTPEDAVVIDEGLTCEAAQGLKPIGVASS